MADRATAGLFPPENVVVFGPDANCTLDICPAEMSVYGYRPSLAANISFIALYAFACGVHVYLGIRWKTWFFMACMIIGCVNAMIGYAGRVAMYYNPFNFAAFMVQIICVTTGPVYYCAAIYVTLALAIQFFSPTLSRFPPKLFYCIFIPCDLVSLILQAAGGGLSTSTSGQSQIGVDLALAGLAFQVFTICVFCAFFADYLVRYFRYSHRGNGQGQEETRAVAAFGVRMRLFFGFMGAAVVLIVARCVYRLVELREGYSGELIKDEGLFLGLEGVMVLASVYCLMIGHPGLVFRSASGDVDKDR